MADNKKRGSLTVAVMHGGPPPVRGLHEPPEPEPDADEQGGPSDQDQDDQGMDPSWLDYTTEAERCNSCQHMGDDGTCSVLKMQVGPGDHCKAYEPKAAEASQGGVPPPPDIGGGYGQ